MTDDDYAAFCNFAFDLRQQAEACFAAMGDEALRHLGGVIRTERAACPNGKVEPAWDFLAAILNEEITERDDPNRNIVRMPRRSSDVLF
jgi:hypothetical protein